jgi:hypothetical protein
MRTKINTLDAISWIFGLIIFTIGVMNLFLVHPFPGIIYIILSFVFFPPTNTIMKKKFNFSIPFSIKIILFILIMWPTLAVGDLAEMYGL